MVLRYEIYEETIAFPYQNIGAPIFPQSKI